MTYAAHHPKIQRSCKQFDHTFYVGCFQILSEAKGLNIFVMQFLDYLAILSPSFRRPSVCRRHQTQYLHYSDYNVVYGLEYCGTTAVTTDLIGKGNGRLNPGPEIDENVTKNLILPPQRKDGLMGKVLTSKSTRKGPP